MSQFTRDTGKNVINKRIYKLTVVLKITFNRF